MFKSTYFCGSKPVRANGLEQGVFLVRNEKNARFAGVITCKSSWLCPVCSARMMAKYSTEIGIAIDALAQPKYNQTAFMITFTIPHSRNMSAYETTEILYNTWKNFVVHGNKKANSKYYVKVDGKKTMKVSDKKTTDPFSMFCEEFNCKHRVRVGEYTYGEHGWHPHFHCLFWVDNDKFKYVKDWQATLEKRWLELAKRNTLKMWNKLYPDKREKNELRLDFMYGNLDKGSHSCFISVDKTGEVIRQKSSMYICGWGADKELTGNVQNKASAEGHFTPRQLLEKYCEGDEKSGKLYLEYCRATRRKKHARINFSTRSGIKKIIAEYRKTKEYAEVMKKKATDEAKANGIWKMVCWFKSEQWRDIYLAEQTTKFPVRLCLLKLAMLDNGRKLIEDFLLNTYNIDIRNNGEHRRVDIYADTFKFVA